MPVQIQYQTNDSCVLRISGTLKRVFAFALVRTAMLPL
jgi:hypothetical protein